MALAALPWKEILKGATLVVSLARDLRKQQASEPRQPVDPTADVRSQLMALSKRVEGLEASGAEQAEVVKILADELQALARRAVVGYWAGIAGLVIALVSLAVAILPIASSS